MNLAKLTPADLGILAAALDVALAAGYGDDGICDEIAAALEANDIASGATAWSIAFDFFRQSIGGK